MKVKFRFLMLALFLGAVSPQAFAGTWHPEITHRPRLLYTSSELNAIRTRLASGIYSQLWNNNFKSRYGEDIYGIYWRGQQTSGPAPNTYQSPRNFADPRARIAKNAAFVYAMNKRADGVNDLDSYTGPNDPHPRDWYKDHALEYLRTIDWQVLWVTPLYLANSPEIGGQIIDNWQWRAKELIYYCEAYDMLRGATTLAEGDIDSIETKLAGFAHTLFYAYWFSMAGFSDSEGGSILVGMNNHRLMMAAALGIAAITVNSHPGVTTTVPPNDQYVPVGDYTSSPSDWIGWAMVELDNVMFTGGGEDGKATVGGRQSSDTHGGYAEGPYYLRYAMMHLLPFFKGMKNFNGDWEETYTDPMAEGRSATLRCPWYDPRYEKVYDWVTKLRMPMGRLPAWLDSYQDAYFPELSILGGYYAWPYQSFDPSLTNEALLNWQLAQPMDNRIDYICAGHDGNQNPQEPPWPATQILPETGDAVFRSGWGNNDVYIHTSAKHGYMHDSADLHDHADATSFILTYNGIVLGLDGGLVKLRRICRKPRRVMFSRRAASP